MEDDNQEKQIFTEDDFDKIKSEDKWFSKHLKLSLLGLSMVIVIILAIVFVFRGYPNGEASFAKSPVNDSMAKDSVYTKNIVDSLKVDTTSNSAIVKSQVKTKDVLIGSTVEDTDGEKPTAVSDDVQKEAFAVIRGKYGNNPTRSRLLKERYHEIQNKVNEMYRNNRVR